MGWKTHHRNLGKTSARLPVVSPHGPSPQPPPKPPENEPADRGKRYAVAAAFGIAAVAGAIVAVLGTGRKMEKIQRDPDSLDAKVRVVEDERTAPGGETARREDTTAGEEKGTPPEAGSPAPPPGDTFGGINPTDDPGLTERVQYESGLVRMKFYRFKEMPGRGGIDPVEILDEDK